MAQQMNLFMAIACCRAAHNNNNLAYDDDVKLSGVCGLLFIQSFIRTASEVFLKYYSEK
jgi:hypothetical protein